MTILFDTKHLSATEWQIEKARVYTAVDPKWLFFRRDDVDDAGEEMAEEEAEDAQMQDMMVLDIDAGEWSVSLVYLL